MSYEFSMTGNISIPRENSNQTINIEALDPSVSSPKRPGASILVNKNPNLSLHANALAMKYISNDDILIQQKEKTVQSPRLVRFHHKVIENDTVREVEGKKKNLFGDAQSPDMSLATRAYMERYGIIEAQQVDKPAFSPTQHNMSNNNRMNRFLSE